MNDVAVVGWCWRRSGAAWSDADLESRRAALLAQLHEHEADWRRVTHVHIFNQYPAQSRAQPSSSSTTTQNKGQVKKGLEEQKQH